MTFDTPLSSIATIKRPTLGKLERLDLSTVRDLLYHFPYRFEDYSATVPIAKLQENALCTVEGKVASLEAGQTWRKKMFLTEVGLEDASGTLRILWFNERYVAQTLKAGMLIRASGKVTRDRDGLLMTNPAFERSSRDATHTGRLVPVYPETAGLTSRFFRWQLAGLFQKLQTFPDPIPQKILERLHLPGLRPALAAIHFPKDRNQELVARKRFAFDEMLFVQLKALQMKRLFETAAALPLPSDATLVASFLDRLPFELTGAQKRAAQEILADLARPRPMNRLLNGDVGSGKTVVAALAAFVASRRESQTALLAPTEILARQHAESLARLFDGTGIGVALLTGSYHLLDGDPVTRATLVKAIGSGIPKVVVGTHALLQDDVSFQRLALIVVDEQHRFGVTQRARLQELSFVSADGSNETVPHFLSMTATPIPRTLALAYFGNLDLSLLDEMPKNRKPVITRLARTAADRERVYAFIRSEAAQDRQTFIIFPLVEASLALAEVKAAVAEHRRLEETVFPNLSIGLLHGRLKAKEKEAIMRDFHAKKYAILVSTAVVEVGIDVPNATVILIEEAERFGLSQLHQFRGRVGRGEHQSYCFLLPGKTSAENDRLKALTEHTDGFAIAEADLALRGPGAFFGTRQSGLPDIAMENLTNVRLVKIAHTEAAALLAADPSLARHPLLKQALQRFEERIHLE